MTPDTPRAWLAYIRKALTTAAGVSALLITQGWLHGWVLAAAQLVLAVATVAGVYRAKNGPRPGTPGRGR